VPLPTPRQVTTNRLLDALPRRDRERLLALCEHVELSLGDVLCEPGERIRHVFFPSRGIISLITPIEAGASLEVGLVGHEGVLGSSLILGINIAPQRALVQGPGTAWRVGLAPFRRELEHSSALRLRLNRYLYVLLCQVAQTAACSHFHVVNARLARWLLMTRDRALCDEFYITQEFMSFMLGVRREGVNRAAASLQERDLIRYSRGQITILDRRGLAAAACGCYVAAKEIYERILG
jgi:CRP-like cAMP-binding protein